MTQSQKINDYNIHSQFALIKRQIADNDKKTAVVIRKELNSILTDSSYEDRYDKDKRVIHTDLVTDLIFSVMTQSTIPILCKGLNITRDEYDNWIDYPEGKLEAKLLDDLRWETYYDIYGDLCAIFNYLDIKIDTTLTNDDGTPVYL